MDKIKITSFRDEIASAILNSQDKLNFHKNEKGEFDAYIDEEELPAVLNFFGEKDVSKLLKTSDSPSVFGNGQSDSGTDLESSSIGDTVELQQQGAAEDDAISTYGTAAFELNTKVKTDLSISASDNPYAQQVDYLQKEKASKEKKDEGALDIVYKIEALENMVGDYYREHPDAEKEHLTIEKISYGKNGEKKASLSQTFGLNGNNAFNGNSATTASSNTEKKDGEGQEGEGSDTNTDNSGSSSASATVSYNIDFRTLNDKYKGNWHIKGTVNAGSDNSDLHGAVQYTKAYKNNKALNFTGNIRETIENKNNVGSYGASVDYRANKLSTGGYGIYYHKEDDGVKEKEYYLEAYGKYGNTFIGSGGLKHYNDIDYKYVKGLIQGKREFPNIGLTLKGGVGAEYGTIDNGTEGMSQTEYKIKAKGEVAFKSKDLNAAVAVNATTGKQSTHFMDFTPTTKRTTTIGVMGRVETKNFDIKTAFSALSVNESGLPEETSIDDSPTSVTVDVAVGVKKVFGDKFMPIFKFSTGNYDGAAQNLGVGIKVTM